MSSIELSYRHAVAIETFKYICLCAVHHIEQGEQAVKFV